MYSTSINLKRSCFNSPPASLHSQSRNGLRDHLNHLDDSRARANRSCRSLSVPTTEGRKGGGKSGGRRGGGKGGTKGGKGKGGWSGARLYKRSDGSQHLGTSLRQETRPFPLEGRSGPPLRILPIGGLGEIGMNCMLVGNYDRYILLDAGLMFPDYDELGIQKVLPDISFLAQWKDKIEAVFITHGHEDHIGALPWVIPALDPSTPIYTGGLTMQLVKRRMLEFNLWDDKRFKTVEVGQRFQAGPFELEPIRVTHSIPDCFGCIFRCDDGTIVHTGDWKIDEDPVDGQMFDRATFEKIGQEGVTLMMSDSTNVLSPGRTTSEQLVTQSLLHQVQGHEGRIIATQFASNLHRLHSMKKAADSVGRKLCFIGASLNSYLEAAWKNDTAPFDPSELLDPSELENVDPNKVLIITTGSQAEPMAQLSLASRGASRTLKLRNDDLLLYSAKCIPGNEKKVMRMMNRIAAAGPRIRMGAQYGLHTSGHACADELAEVIKLVQPQHFLPVHGEYAFLRAHETLAREHHVCHTDVIRNGTMLGLGSRRNNREIAQSSFNAGNDNSGFYRLGEVDLTLLYNDGNDGTGNQSEMKLAERMQIATDGIVVVSVELLRPNPKDPQDPQYGETRPFLTANFRVTTRAMWTDEERLVEAVEETGRLALRHLPCYATLVQVERHLMERIRKAVMRKTQKRPEVLVLANESSPTLVAKADVTRGGKRDRKSGKKGRRARTDKQGPSEDTAPESS